MSESRPVMLRVSGLGKSYRRRHGWRMQAVRAIHDIDLAVERGSTMAVVGPSGSGKSTLARCIVGMETPDTGDIRIGDVDRSAMSAREQRTRRREVQLIFQDASTAMNPRFTAEDIVAEPLLIEGWGTDAQRRERARELMGEVRLRPEWGSRRAGELSGGQQQRLALARALAARPQLLVLDESLSGLDLSTEAQVANLLLDLQAAHDLTYILISHDFALVSKLADQVVMMSNGTIVDRGATADVIERPQHPLTKELLESAIAMQTELSELASGAGA